MNTTKEQRQLINAFMDCGGHPAGGDFMNWHIMDVVEKIERLYATEESWGVTVDIYTAFVTIRHCVNGIVEYRSKIAGTCLQSPEKVKFATKLEAIYYCVLSFIRWYNTQKQKDL